MTGTTLNQFQITAKLGQGGMGEVYRARDTKLGREVAIKVLPTSFTSLPESAARFEREAKALATLNHPGIASIYGFDVSEGAHFLVMELVEGETLEERLRRGALAVDEALDVGRQIAEALEAAHERGIIHRDLKPSNVKITPQGRVKLLDFGLAKAVTESSDGALADSPTILGSIQSTMPGVILGTAAYMSPEQARGKAVDEQSDIWSFGVVLYECLSGRKLFTGESVGDIIAAVLRAPIEFKDLPPETPLSVQQLASKCLSRQRKTRLQHIGDARLDLERAISEPEPKPRLSEEGKRKPPRTMVLLSAVALALLCGAAGWFLRAPPVGAPPTPRRVDLLLRGLDQSANISPGCSFALSPDGRTLVYSFAQPGSPDTLRARFLDSGSDEGIPGTSGGYHPFFSPDGQTLGFVTRTELKTIPVSAAAGAASVLAPVVQSRGAAWGKDGTIVYAPNPQSSLFKISSSGGPAAAVTRLAGNEISHRFPQFLPDGKHVLFISIQNYDFRQGSAVVVELATGRQKVVKQNCAFARFAPSGHLLFVVDRVLYASAFDPARLELKGRAAPVASDLRVTTEGGAQYDAAQGTLLFLAGAPGQRRLMWLDAEGKLSSASEQTGEYGDFFRMSPDEKRVAVRSAAQGYLLDLERNLSRRFGSGLGRDGGTIWSPDGQWLIYASIRGERGGLWRKKADWSADEELITDTGPVFDVVFPMGLTPDGKFVLFTRRVSETEFGLWRTPFGGGGGPEIIAKWRAKIINSALLSPDGQWLAYISDESGWPQLYLRPLGREGAVQQLSREGATFVQWSPAGDRLYFSSSGKIWSVLLRPGPGVLEAGQPEQFVELPAGTAEMNWQVAADGKRVLILVDDSLSRPRNAGPGTPVALKLIFNWAEDGEKLQRESGR